MAKITGTVQPHSPKLPQDNLCGAFLSSLAFRHLLIGGNFGGVGHTLPGLDIDLGGTSSLMLALVGSDITGQVTGTAQVTGEVTVEVAGEVADEVKINRLANRKNINV